MHVNYPNAADRILGSRTNPGGDIFLHGNCASIGCIPITDDGIKEVYWLAVLVRESGAKHLPIQIFPARMTELGFRDLAKTHLGQPEPVRNFTFYVLTKSFEDIRHEIEAKNGAPDREKFVAALKLSPELKGWMRAHDVLDLTMPGLDKVLTPDDILGVPELLLAYQR